MSIIRREATRNFTIIKNEIVNDENLSMEAMGLLTYMLSKPDGWEFRQDNLGKRFNVGRERMRSTMRCLCEAGYVRRHKENDPVTGHIRTITIVSDEPIIDQQAAEPQVGEPKSENPPLGEAVPLVNTDYSKTELSKTKKEKGAAKNSPLVDLPDWIPLENWNAFIENRKQLKKPATEKAIKLLIAKLETFKNQGHNIAEILDQSTISGWSGVFLVNKGLAPAKQSAHVFTDDYYKKAKVNNDGLF